MPGLVAQARRHRRKSLFLPFIRRTKLRTHTVQRSTAIGREDRLLRHARRERGKSGAWRNAYLPIVVLKVVPSRRAVGAVKNKTERMSFQVVCYEGASKTLQPRNNLIQPFPISSLFNSFNQFIRPCNCFIYRFKNIQSPPLGIIHILPLISLHD